LEGGVLLLRKKNMLQGVIKYEQNWIDGLNRGDVSPATYRKYKHPFSRKPPPLNNSPPHSLP